MRERREKQKTGILEKGMIERREAGDRNMIEGRGSRRPYYDRKKGMQETGIFYLTPHCLSLGLSPLSPSNIS